MRAPVTSARTHHVFIPTACSRAGIGWHFDLLDISPTRGSQLCWTESSLLFHNLIYRKHAQYSPIGAPSVLRAVASACQVGVSLTTVLTSPPWQHPGQADGETSPKPIREGRSCTVLFSAKGSQGDVSTSIIVSSYAIAITHVILYASTVATAPNSAICRGKARAGAADWMHIFESPPALLAL